MQVIHKQRLRITDIQVVRLPVNAQILCVQSQRDQICIWYRFDDQNQKTQDVRFYILPTGEPETVNREPLEYVGTVQIHGGDLVWHVFREPIELAYKQYPAADFHDLM